MSLLLLLPLPPLLWTLPTRIASQSFLRRPLLRRARRISCGPPCISNCGPPRISCIPRHSGDALALYPAGFPFNSADAVPGGNAAPVPHAPPWFGWFRRSSWLSWFRFSQLLTNPLVWRRQTLRLQRRVSQLRPAATMVLQFFYIIMSRKKNASEEQPPAFVALDDGVKFHSDLFKR